MAEHNLALLQIINSTASSSSSYYSHETCLCLSYRTFPATLAWGLTPLDSRIHIKFSPAATTAAPTRLMTLVFSYLSPSFSRASAFITTPPILTLLLHNQLLYFLLIATQTQKSSDQDNPASSVHPTHPPDAVASWCITTPPGNSLPECTKLICEPTSKTN